jgi:hypothetical protein
MKQLFTAVPLSLAGVGLVVVAVTIVPARKFSPQTHISPTTQHPFKAPSEVTLVTWSGEPLSNIFNGVSRRAKPVLTEAEAKRLANPPTCQSVGWLSRVFSLRSVEAGTQCTSFQTTPCSGSYWYDDTNLCQSIGCENFYQFTNSDPGNIGLQWSGFQEVPISNCDPSEGSNSVACPCNNRACEVSH